jgi:hypothetical protein
MIAPTAVSQARCNTNNTDTGMALGREQRPLSNIML